MKSKLWIERHRWQRYAILHMVEPHEHNGWRWESDDPDFYTIFCRRDVVERVLGFRVPPQPYLLEVEITARVVKVWEPA